MSVLMNPKVVDRLGALCGMLGSDHAGEQAAAATAATALLRRIGMTWRELVQRAFDVVEDDDPPDLQDTISECLASSCRITSWERDFLLSIAADNFSFDDLSAKQAAVLNRIIAKVRR